MNKEEQQQEPYWEFTNARRAWLKIKDEFVQLASRIYTPDKIEYLVEEQKNIFDKIDSKTREGAMNEIERKKDIALGSLECDIGLMENHKNFREASERRWRKHREKYYNEKEGKK